MAKYNQASLKNALCVHIGHHIGISTDMGDYDMKCIRPRVGFTHGFEINTKATTDYVRVRVYIKNTMVEHYLRPPTLEADDQSKVGPEDTIRVVLGALNLGNVDYCVPEAGEVVPSADRILYEDGSGAILWDNGDFMTWS